MEEAKRMKETPENRFVPSGAIAFFAGMIVFYALVWFIVYGLMVAWR